MLKKSTIIILILFIFTSLFAQTYDNESERKIVQNLSDWYDTMIEHPDYSSIEAYENFISIKTLIEDGYPGIKIDSSAAEYVEKWERLLLAYEQFWTLNCPWDLFIYSIRETSNELELAANINRKYTEKYEIFETIFKQGFSKAKKLSKNNTRKFSERNYNWPKTSVLVTNECIADFQDVMRTNLSSNKSKEYNGVVSSIYGIENFNVFFYFISSGNKIIGKSEKENKINFELKILCNSEEGKNKILNGLFEIQICDIYITGKDKNGITSKKINTDSVNCYVNCHEIEKKYILRTMRDEIKKYGNSRNLELFRNKQINQILNEHFVFIPRSTYYMGNVLSPEAKKILNYGNKKYEYTDDYLMEQIPVHTIEVDNFFIMKTEVPNYLYFLIIDPAKVDLNDTKMNEPIDNLSWYDAIFFCNKLSIFMGLSPCYKIENEEVVWDRNANGFRLPTEAEWEFAARGANKSENFIYSGTNDSQAIYSYDKREVNSGLRNEIKLYNMSGNVSEWCWDWYSNYDSDLEIQEFKVLRGGDYTKYLKISYESPQTVYAREGCYPNSLYNKGHGLRLVKSVP